MVWLSKAEAEQPGCVQHCSDHWKHFLLCVSFHVCTILLFGKFGSVFLNCSAVLFLELSSRNWRNTSLEILRFFIFLAPLISSVDYDKTAVNLEG